MDDKEHFRPEIVDEQIDALLQASSTAEKEARTVHDLQDLYQSDLQSLKRVRKRLDLGSDTNFEEESWLSNSHYNNTLSHHERSQPMQGQHTQRSGTSPRQVLIRRFGLIAAVLVAALLVGSLITALNIMRGQHSNVATTSNPSQVKTSAGLYIRYFNGVIKVDPMTGKTIWRYNLPQTKEMPQTAITHVDSAGNTLFVIANGKLKNGMYAGGMVALNAQNGATLWQKQLPPTGVGAMTWNNMTVANGNAYVISTDNKLKSEIVALDATTGATKTSYGLSLLINQISWDSGNLYLGTTQGLYVVNAQDGKVVWKDQGTEPGQRYSVLLYIENKIVYAAFNGNNSSYLKAYDAQNGTSLWQGKNFNGMISRSITISGQQMYANVITYGQPPASSITAFNINNGDVNWSVSAPSMASLPIGAPEVIDGVVYFPTTVSGQKGEVYTLNALNALTGKRLWQKPVDQGLAYYAALSNNIAYAARLDALPEPNTVIISAYTIDGKRLWQITINEDVLEMITQAG
ncbi:outer membrane protein assembly factor BamB family protein [Dictyobacter kobayashii]|uniref:Pyrrolo-quinoline quinone repeat domain-containing protein n=1 Tax=Dictyobacter kobayashii TaxID=2014872 RepID=A0A402AVE2_9CHLR|nr:PQQ-binding-like beta-propeller repeat protein [Dictyobacter kobayashii]GCE23045.1 hypothetical protein KDK_68450 [Dictyobacter kobayashii]